MTTAMVSALAQRDVLIGRLHDALAAVVGHERQIGKAGHDEERCRNEEREAPAERQAAITAVHPLAIDTPILPQIPLNAMVRPRTTAASTTIGVPTG